MVSNIFRLLSLQRISFQLPLMGVKELHTNGIPGTRYSGLVLQCASYRVRVLVFYVALLRCATLLAACTVRALHATMRQSGRLH